MTLPDPLHAYTLLTDEQCDQDRKVRRRVIRLLAWSALATGLFTAWAVVVS